MPLNTGFVSRAKVMKCLGQGAPNPEKQCHCSTSVYLWWGWGGGSICGGEEGDRFPGNFHIDGYISPPVSSCRLIPAHSTALKADKLLLKATQPQLLQGKEEHDVHNMDFSGSYVKSSCWLWTLVSLCMWRENCTTETMVALASAPQPVSLDDFRSL